MAAQPLDGIVLPGGESSAMAVLLESFDLLEPLRAYVRAGKAVWGTCAGMILL
ncbi:SNO glutamine amidotransferase, partial [Caulochytrium protostelioides]